MNTMYFKLLLLCMCGGAGGGGAVQCGACTCMGIYIPSTSMAYAFQYVFANTGKMRKITTTESLLLLNIYSPAQFLFNTPESNHS